MGYYLDTISFSAISIFAIIISILSIILTLFFLVVGVMGGILIIRLFIKTMKEDKRLKQEKTNNQQGV